MGAQHPGHSLHRLQPAAHRTVTPIVQEAPGPDHGFVLPEVGERFLQFPGASGGQFAGQQDIELLACSSAYPTGATESFRCCRR